MEDVRGLSALLRGVLGCRVRPSLGLRGAHASTGTAWIFALCAAGLSSQARADWGVAGAQYLCDPKAHVFELLPYARSSDDPPEGTPLKTGYKEIPPGAPAFACELGSLSLRVVIRVFPPASHGMGMGAGFVRAQSISVADIELLADSPAFDWSIDPQTPPLIRIRITAVGQGTVNVDRCYAQNLAGERCESKEVPFAALARAQADSLRPADPEVQKEHSATRLPPELDYANAFVTHDVSGVPVCAHLHSTFLRGISNVPPAAPTLITRAGRIAGTPHERVHIRSANPQVCDASAEPGCRSTAYLIPGDRVDVGFVCGAWTYIRYTPRTRATGVIFGWVPTSNLYDVDSSITTHAPQQMGDLLRGTSDPLLLAVLDHDPDKVRALLKAAANPDGLNPRAPGTPLRFAILNDDVQSAAALLEAGANSNNPTVLWEAMTASSGIWEVLRRSKMDPRGLPLAQLAGLERLDANEETAELTGRWKPVKDLPALVQRVIDAGAPIDKRDQSGQTALSNTFKSNNVDVAELLLKAAASPNLEIEGKSLLMTAVDWYPNSYDPTIIVRLLEAGAEPNFRSKGEYRKPEEGDLPCCLDDGQTALTRAAEQGYAAVVKALLAHGADPSIGRSDGALPADIARAASHPDVEALIREYMRRAGSVYSKSHVMLTFEGVGAIKIGMSCADLTNAGYQGCGDSDRNGNPNSSAACVDLGFMNWENHQLPRFDGQLRDGLLQRIDVTFAANPTNDSTVVTAEGIHVRSTEDEVRSVYRGRAQERRGSIYGVTQANARPGERHAFVLRSDDGQRGLLIETGGGEVVAMHVGVIHDFYVLREDGGVTIVAPTCLAILEGPPGPSVSYPP